MQGVEGPQWPVADLTSDVLDGAVERNQVKVAHDGTSFHLSPTASSPGGPQDLDSSEFAAYHWLLRMPAEPIGQRRRLNLAADQFHQR